MDKNNPDKLLYKLFDKDNSQLIKDDLGKVIMFKTKEKAKEYQKKYKNSGVCRGGYEEKGIVIE
jgi:hypothetical protein